MTLHVNSQSRTKLLSIKNRRNSLKKCISDEILSAQSHSLIKKFTREYLLLSLVPVLSFFSLRRPLFSWTRIYGKEP